MKHSRTLPRGRLVPRSEARSCVSAAEDWGTMLREVADSYEMPTKRMKVHEQSDLARRSRRHNPVRPWLFRIEVMVPAVRFSGDRKKSAEVSKVQIPF